MKNVIILATFAIIAFLQTVSASYWTVRYRTEREQYNWFWSEYEYWSTNLTISVHEGKATQLTCAMSFGYETQDLLFNIDKGYSGGCYGSPLVGPRGTSTELHALAINNGPNIPCALIEVGKGYKTYICGSSIPPVNISELKTSATTAIATTTATTVATTTATTVATTTVTTTKTITTTATATATPSCKSGYEGKRNGQGPNGACCSHSNDCLDTCVSGICGVHP